MSGNICVLAEQWRGQLNDVTYELLSTGKELAESLGVGLNAALLGHNVKGQASSLGAASTVYCVDHPSLADPCSEILSQALAAVARESQPRCLLIPLTNVTWDVGSLLAAQLNAPYINLCQDIRAVDGNIEATCVLYGGKMEAKVSVPEGLTVVGILPGSRAADKSLAEGACSVVDVSASLPDEPQVKFKSYIEPEAGDVDIAMQEVLVAVGRGIQTQDNVELAEELAGALGGAVAGSRPVIDQGWLPLTRQVGKSGKQVKPKFYLALGISGAPEHLEGMRAADLIVAVNTDPSAPIFSVAHYGVPVDLFDIVPLLTEKVKERKGGG